MERGRALTDILILILISSLCERPSLFSSSQTCSMSYLHFGFPERLF